MKKILYIFFGLFALYVLLALFGPSAVKVEKQIVINRDRNLVMEKLLDLQYFNNTWSPWKEKDPDMVATFKGQAGQTGQQLSWSGNDAVGTGTLEITGLGMDTIYQKLSFEGQGDAKVYYILQDTAGQTRVRWGMIFAVGFFGRTPMLFMNMDKMIGKDYEIGLVNLKKAIEREPLTNDIPFEISVLDREACTYLGRRETVNFAAMGPFFERSFGELDKVMKEQKIEALSASAGIYFLYDEAAQKTDMSCAFKVAPGTKVKGWESFTYPAGKAVFVRFKGDPAQSMKAHEAIGNYIRSNSLNYSVIIEEYVVWPEKGKDVSAAVTDIYYLLK